VKCEDCKYFKKGHEGRFFKWTDLCLLMPEHISVDEDHFCYQFKKKTEILK